MDIPSALTILAYLRAAAATSGIRPTITFRSAIGVGEITVSGKPSPYEQDGPAFVRSRRGLEELAKQRQRWTKIVTGETEIDRLADVILLLLDRLQKNWTVPQWEAVKWSLQGLTREQIARKLKVAHQNITKRLAAAGWQQFKEATEFLSGIIHTP